MRAHWTDFAAPGYFTSGLNSVRANPAAAAPTLPHSRIPARKQPDAFIIVALLW